MFVSDFCDLLKNDISLAGGKGANLGELTASGINVPKGFVVTSDAYLAFLQENELEKFINAQISEAGSDIEKLGLASDRISERILAAELPDEVREAVKKAFLEKWPEGGTPVAVRSSATAEDLEDASFAGQQETFLNVRGLDDLYKSILKCYASLWGRRAVIYRMNSGYGGFSVALAAVIQEMVESETAGVLFTVDPVSKDPEKIQINAAYGLGESVVSGRVTPDEYVCSRDGKVLRRIIGSKAAEIIYIENGSGTRTLEVSEERRSSPALNDEEISELVKQALLIENHYGCPMDIEWAVSKGKVYILQARAITTLNTAETDLRPTEEDMQEARRAAAGFKGFSLENMIFLLEKMPFVYTHLDRDFGDVIGQVKTDLFSSIGLKLDADIHLDDNGIQSLPDGKKSITLRIFNFFRLYRKFRNSSWTLERIESSGTECRKLLSEAESINTAGLSFEDSIKALDKLHEDIAGLCRSRFLYAFFPAYVQGKKAEKAVKRADPDWSSAEMTLDLDYRTALITRDQKAMAKRLSADPDFLHDALSGMTYDEAILKYPELQEEISTFLKKHGYKSDYNCYCLHARTWNEDPSRLYQTMLPQLRAVNETPETAPSLTIGKVKDKVHEMLKGKKYDEFLVNLDIYRECHVLREESQYCWEGLFAAVRRIISHIETFLDGQLDDPSDIQYLSFDELKYFKETEGKVIVPDALLNKISTRKAHHPEAVRKWNAAKKALLERAAEVNNSKIPAASGSVLFSGTGGSGGVAEGPVTIVRSPAEFGKLHKGDVLVCPYTDPEWTALFSLASAVVADTGGTLSHAAIVAREYGIPAVLGVGFGTEQLHDGDRIRVDGDNGTVSAL